MTSVYLPLTLSYIAHVSTGYIDDVSGDPLRKDESEAMGLLARVRDMQGDECDVEARSARSMDF